MKNLAQTDPERVKAMAKQWRAYADRAFVTPWRGMNKEARAEWEAAKKGK